MRIVVMGAGGMGAYYGGLLAQKQHSVTFIARGPHLKALQEKGLSVKSLFGDFEVRPATATDMPSAVGATDLVLFCTKSYDTDAAAQELKTLVGAQTTILSLQNGIDSVERIGRILGMEHMLAGATWISSAVVAPGVIDQVSDFRRVVVGELDGRISPRLEAIYNALKDTGITVELSEDIRKVLWTKFVFIAAASGFGSLTRLPMASYRSIPETRALIAELMREIEALAAAAGVKLDPDLVEKSLAFMDRAAPHIKASMQLDIESGHRSEIESTIGVIGRKGQELGVPTPVADMIYGSLLPVDLVARGHEQVFN